MDAAISGQRRRGWRTAGAPAPAAGAVTRHRRTAIVVGLLFLIGDVAGVLSYLVTQGLLEGPDALARRSPRARTGSCWERCWCWSWASRWRWSRWCCSRSSARYNEVLATGCVVFRGALETVGYMATAGTWLLLVGLSGGSAGAASPDAPYVQNLTAFLAETAGSATAYLTSIVFSLGALMFYALFYQSRLVPRWLSVWGLAGAVLYLAAPLLDMTGHGFGLLMAPLAVAELVLAAWLIFSGLDVVAPTPAGPAARCARAGGSAPPPAARPPVGDRTPGRTSRHRYRSRIRGRRRVAAGRLRALSGRCRIRGSSRPHLRRSRMPDSP